jgi:hypothetical protein
VSHHDDPIGERREDGPRGRSPLTWLLAGVAVAIIAVTAIFLLTRGGEESPAPGSSGATDATSEAGTEATVTELSAPDAATGRCMAPSVDVLAGKPVAFDGTVEEVEDGLVTLTATHWYAGEPTDLVTIEAPPEVLGRLLTSVDFVEDERYLVAASESGAVMICGFSGPYSDGLAAMYAEAFGS